MHVQAIKTVQEIFDNIIEADNLIDLRFGTILKNLRKDYHRIAGSLIDAWAFQQLVAITKNKNNAFGLLDVKAGKRLDLYDFLLFFKFLDEEPEQPIYVDSKATSLDIETSGRNPNLVSFGKIRSLYLRRPHLIYIIVSFKHSLSEQGITVKSVEAFELKDLAASDIVYNKRLNQLQLRNIFNVGLEPRTVNDFIRLIDEKFIRSRGRRDWEEEVNRFR